MAAVPPPPPEPPPPPPAAWYFRLFDAIRDNMAGILITLLLVVFLGVLIVALWYSGTSTGGQDFIGRLRDREYARGLITFIISVSTIILGFVLVMYSLFGGADPDEQRFRRGREVFSGLMGVLGTIVGFYFGASQPTTRDLQAAPIDVITSADGTRQVVTYVSGGTAPYHYVVRYPDSPAGKESAAVSTRVAEAGWIRETVPAGAGNRVEIVVTDHMQKQVSVSRDLTPERGTSPEEKKEEQKKE
jgi:hypothetical protein